MKKNELSIIGASLKEERRLLGMTQRQVAQQFGISLKALRNLEQGSGAVTLSTAIKILEFFGKQLRVGDLVVTPQTPPASRPRRDQILEILRLVRPVLEKKFHAKDVALFGSCARDEATKKSDIDLAVCFSEPPTFSRLGKLTALLETLFEGRRVDLVEMEKMTPEVAKAARKDFIHV